MLLPSQLGEIPAQGSAKLLSMLEQSTVVSKFKALFHDGKQQKKNQWKGVLSGRTICFPVLGLTWFLKSTLYLLITQCLHIHPQEKYVYPSISLVYYRYDGLSAYKMDELQLLTLPLSMEWSPWILSPDLWVGQPFFCSREWAAQST